DLAELHLRRAGIRCGTCHPWRPKPTRVRHRHGLSSAELPGCTAFRDSRPGTPWSSRGRPHSNDHQGEPLSQHTTTEPTGTKPLAVLGGQPEFPDGLPLTQVV